VNIFKSWFCRYGHIISEKIPDPIRSPKSKLGRATRLLQWENENFSDGVAGRLLSFIAGSCLISHSFACGNLSVPYFFLDDLLLVYFTNFNRFSNQSSLHIVGLTKPFCPIVYSTTVIEIPLSERRRKLPLKTDEESEGERIRQ
jgi:hypothetical protein